jgi:hypothetical protein
MSNQTTISDGQGHVNPPESPPYLRVVTAHDLPFDELAKDINDSLNNTDGIMVSRSKQRRAERAYTEALHT